MALWDISEGPEVLNTTMLPNLLEDWYKFEGRKGTSGKVSQLISHFFKNNPNKRISQLACIIRILLSTKHSSRFWKKRRENIKEDKTEGRQQKESRKKGMGGGREEKRERHRLAASVGNWDSFSAYYSILHGEWFWRNPSLSLYILVWDYRFFIFLWPITHEDRWETENREQKQLVFNLNCRWVLWKLVYWWNNSRLLWKSCLLKFYKVFPCFFSGLFNT